MPEFTHFAAEAGCLPYLVLEEIRRCLGLRGGVNHDGHHWVYKSCQELAKLFGKARNTISNALNRLVELGVLHREQLGTAVGHWCNRAYYYRLADGAPGWMHGSRRGQGSTTLAPARNATSAPPARKGNTASFPPARNPTRRDGAVHCSTAEQSNRRSTPDPLTTRGNSPKNPRSQEPKQPERKEMAVPGARKGLQQAWMWACSKAQPEKDADGFLIRPEQAVDMPLNPAGNGAKGAKGAKGGGLGFAC